jgi:hypothetical protein
VRLRAKQDIYSVVTSALLAARTIRAPVANQPQFACAPQFITGEIGESRSPHRKAKLRILTDKIVGHSHRETLVPAIQVEAQKMVEGCLSFDGGGFFVLRLLCLWARRTGCPPSAADWAAIFSHDASSLWSFASPPATGILAGGNGRPCVEAFGQPG